MAPRSRNHSRAASPALSVRSRRSMMSSRSRQKYHPQDLTDDEDSDIEEFTDDSRSRSKRPASVHGGDLKNRMRRRNNSETLELDHRDAEVITRIQRMKEKSKFIRERRSGSLTNWPSTKNRDSGSLSPSDDEIRRIATKYRKSSLTSPPPQPKLQHSMTSSNKKKSTTHSDSASEDLPVNVKKESKIVVEISQQKREQQHVVVEATPEKSQINGISSAVVEEMKLEDEKALKSENRPLKVVSEASSQQVTTATNAKDEKNAQIKLVDWECEHCTFVNDAAAKVCTICCKTRVEVLKTLPNTIDEEEDVELDIKQINESILRNENVDGDLKQKGKVRKISFLPGTKAH